MFPAGQLCPEERTPDGHVSCEGHLLTFRRRIKSRLPFVGFIRRLPYSPRFQDKG